MPSLLEKFSDDKFSEYLGKQGLKVSSINLYVNSIKDYLKFMEQFTNLNEEQFLEQTYEFLQSHKRQWYMRFSIKYFWFYIGQKGLWEKFSFIYRKKFKVQVRRIANMSISFDNIKKMMNLLRVPYKLIIMVQYETAMRWIDVRNLRYGDFAIDENGLPYIKIKVEKTSKLGTFYISDELAMILAKYVKIKNLEKKDLLFPVTKESYNEALKSSAKTIGIDNHEHISSHWIRHSKAQHLRDQGYKDDIIQKLLGHADIRTTISYFADAGEESKMIMKKNRTAW